MTAASTTANKPTGDRWVTGAALAALAARGMAKGDTFTVADLRLWLPQVAAVGLKTVAVRLMKLNFVTSNRAVDVETAEIKSVYTITADGAAAIRVVAGGEAYGCGRKGLRYTGRKARTDTFVARLWALVRARKILDSASAAATLVDAGDDKKVRTAARHAKRYLALWASAGALEVSRVRLPNGCKRYVLVNDTGPTPPAWTRADQARKKAAKDGAIA